MSEDRGVKINSNLVIPFSELAFSYSTSSGAGGQNVNKVSTKATLRWNPATSLALNAEIKERFLNLYQNRLTTEGELILNSQKFRSQPQNVQDCLEKFRNMLLPALVRPKTRKLTRPTLGSKKRRLKTKNARSEVKQNRRSVRSDD